MANVFIFSQSTASNKHFPESLSRTNIINKTKSKTLRNYIIGNLNLFIKIYLVFFKEINIFFNKILTTVLLKKYIIIVNLNINSNLVFDLKIYYVYENEYLWKIRVRKDI